MIINAESQRLPVEQEKDCQLNTKIVRQTFYSQYFELGSTKLFKRLLAWSFTIRQPEQLPHVLVYTNKKIEKCDLRATAEPFSSIDLPPLNPNCATYSRLKTQLRKYTLWTQLLTTKLVISKPTLMLNVPRFLLNGFSIWMIQCAPNHWNWTRDLRKRHQSHNDEG